MATKTLTNAQVIEALRDVIVVQEVKATGLFKLKLAGMEEVLSKRKALIDKIVENLKNEHMVKDADGKPVPRMVGGKVVEGSITLKDYDAFASELEKISEGTSELTIEEITLDEIDALPPFEKSIKGLRPLIKAAS